jgi:hypothetical protein
MGLSGSGKTNFFYQLTKNMQPPSISTIGYNFEILKDKNIIYDIGSYH